jgi:hypothetical protein
VGHATISRLDPPATGDDSRKRGKYGEEGGVGADGSSTVCSADQTDLNADG